MTDRIGDWCEYYHNLNEISHDRRVNQLRVLRALAASMTRPVEEVDGPDLERYMTQMKQAGYHPHTILFHLRLLRPFLRYLWRDGTIEADRWLRLQDVRGPRGAYDGKPRPYSRHELRQFWLELDERYPWTKDRDPSRRTPARGEYWVRRWAAGTSGYKRVYPYARRLQVEAICALALYAGLRRNEIFRIAIPDMHYQNEYVRVVGARKGPDGFEKIRVVAMNPPLALAIGNWVEFRTQVLAPDHDEPWLCLWAGGGAVNSEATMPMSGTQFQALLREIGRGWELHRLRHTFATERYRAGMPIEILQKTLGHTRIQQTLGYAQIDEDRIIAESRATDDKFFKSVQPNGGNAP